MVKYAQFDETGLPKAFYVPEIWGFRTIPVYGETPDATEQNPAPETPIVGYAPNPECKVPVDAVEISNAQWSEFLENPAQRKWLNGQVVEYTPPPPPAPVTVVPAVTLWERLSEAEAEQVNAAMATQPFRTRKIFETANTFRSDHELWPLLVQMATDLFREERAAELLSQ